MSPRDGTVDRRENSSILIWTKKNWAPIAVLLIVLLAFTVRSAFNMGPATENAPRDDEFGMSGGTDPYYHKRIIDHIADEKSHLVHDTASGYPIYHHHGTASNPRPPLWHWTVVVGGFAGSPLTGGDVDAAVWYSLIISTAFWGALSVIPVYFIAKTIFGKKTGIAAAFFMAISASHMQQTILANSDHAAFHMFFTLVGFYFFVKALSSAKKDVWVEDWTAIRTIPDGLKRFVMNERASVMYAAMSGIAFAAVALAWTGFSYIIVILGVYMLVQIFVDRFRNGDSTTVISIFFIMSVVLFLVSAPWYIQTNRLGSWFYQPLYMFLAVLVVGVIFLLTKNLPWTLVLPSLAIIAIIGAALTATLSPRLWASLVGGQGYLVQTKIYSTIAEAQAAEFSKLILSFGVLTFFLALASVVWAIIKFPSHARDSYLFMIVWAVITFFMSMNAARFIYLASPSFAIMAAWPVVLIMKNVDLKSIPRGVKVHGGGFRGIKKGVKPRHVLGVLFLAFLIVFPNMWFAVDAGIPYEEKPVYDAKVYNAMPEFLRPERYDEINGTMWYFGAFGSSLPMRSSSWQRAAYWPDAFTYLSQRDTDVPLEERPAFVSWWDYGFEAIQDGKHPSVADPFQRGVTISGNMLMAQGEDEAIALFIVRLIENLGEGRPFRPGIKDVLTKHLGYDTADLMEDINRYPEEHMYDVLNDPERFGPRTDQVNELTPENMKYTYMKTLIVENTETQADLVDLYRDIRDVTGFDIRYFAVDSRLFPFSAQNTGIFYAPATLSDHRVRGDFSRIPHDFFEILVVTDMGEFIPEDVPPEARVQDYKIDYKEMFYNSMLYRTFIGYTGEEANREPGIPVVHHQDMDIKPAWGMKNFRMIYRTMYWNPYEDYENHTNSWEAISPELALQYQEEEKGVLLPSYAGVYRGVVMLQYFDGAFLNGTVTTDKGSPIPGALVTLEDEYGIPHDHGHTDEDGRYSLLAPFGNISIIVSTGGQFDGFTKRESQVIAADQVNITVDQSMRVKNNWDSERGLWDYNIERNIEVPVSSVSGRVYIDVQGSGEFDFDTDMPLEGSLVTLEIEGRTIIRETFAGEDGTFDFEDVPPGTYLLKAFYAGSLMGEANVAVGTTPVIRDISQMPGGVTGRVTYTDGHPSSVGLITLQNSKEDYAEEIITAYTDEEGYFSFSKIVPGEYVLKNIVEGYFQESRRIIVGSNTTLETNFTIVPSMVIEGLVTDGARVLRNATVRFLSAHGRAWTFRTDAQGRYTAVIPRGDYDVSCRYVSGKVLLALDRIYSGGTLNLTLKPSVRLTGTILNETGSPSHAFIQFSNNEIVLTTYTNEHGMYTIELPHGSWVLYSTSPAEGASAIQRIAASGSYMTRDVLLSPGDLYSIYTLKELDPFGMGSQNRTIPGALLMIRSRGMDFWLRTDNIGQAVITLPAGTHEAKAWAFGYEYTTMTRLNPEEDNILRIPYSKTLVHGTITLPDANPDSGVIRFERDGIEMDATPVSGEYHVELSPGLWTVTYEYVVGDDERYEASEILRVNAGDSDIVLDVAGEKSYLIKLNLDGYDAVTRNETSVHKLSVDIYNDEGENIRSFSLEEEGDGLFSFFSTVGEIYAVIYYAEHAMAAAEVIDVSSAKILDVTLEESGTFSGEILGRDRSPYSFPVPVLFKDTVSGGRASITAVGGSFSFTTVANRLYDIEIDHKPDVMVDGIYVRLSHSATRQRPAARDITPDVIPRDTAVEGSVIGPAGEAFAVSLNFYSQSPTAVDNTASSDSEGRYSVSLTPGEYIVHTYRSGYSSIHTFYIDSENVLSDDVVEFDIVLERGFNIGGLVYYSNITGNMKNMAEEGISVSTEYGSMVKKTDSDGRYSLVFPSGDYVISASSIEVEYDITNTYSGETTVELTRSIVRDFRLERVPLYDSSISVLDDGKTMEPGSSATFSVLVKNTGNTADRISLSSTSEWEVSFSSREFSLPFQGEKTVRVVVKTPEDARVDHDPVSIVATSVNDAEATSSVSLDIDIPQRFGLSASVVQDEVAWNGQEYHARLFVNNTGNGPDSYRIVVLNSHEVESHGWSVDILDADYSIDHPLDGTRFISNITQGGKPLRVVLTAMRDNPSPIDVRLSITSDETSEEVLLVPFQRPVLSIGDVDVTGDQVSDVYDGQAALLTFIIIAGALMVVLALFGKPKKRRR